MSDEPPEPQDPEAALDEFLINLAGDSLVTGWTTTVEAIDRTGTHYLWHLDMPGVSPWHREGLLRASLRSSKAMIVSSDDGEDF